MADENNEGGEEKPSRTSSAKSKSGSKPGTPKTPRSRAGSGRSGSGRAGSAKAKDKAKKDDEEKTEEEKPTDAPADAAEKLSAPPVPDDITDIMAIFLASKSQELFECRADEDVTSDHPYKLLKKEDIIQDMKTRAAVSDFSPAKQLVMDYPGEELLLVYDYDFKHGQNFYLITTEESKDRILNPPKATGEGGEGGVEGEEDQVVEYKPPVPKDWVSYGSEKEIAEEAFGETRPKKVFKIARPRREFGAPVNFTDRDVKDVKDGYVECTPYDDKNYSLHLLELDKATQAIATWKDCSSQTDWKYPRNAVTQYQPREFTEEEKEKLSTSKEVKVFIEGSIPRFELALQQNEIVDVFFDDWLALASDDATFGSKSDGHLKEYQSFTDLQFSKDKTITCIDWHPNLKGVIAVACSERLTFDQRVDNASKTLMTPSLILIWSFTDPIHPQLLLEAPDDIFSFQFNPSDPNIIAGGCINGQVVLWDISQYLDRLKNPRSGGKLKQNSMNALPGFEDENALAIPIIRYCAVSSIENSHHLSITDIQWIPDHLEINRYGLPVFNKHGDCSQILTCAGDSCVMVWDTRAPKVTLNPLEAKKQDAPHPLGIPATFKHLDLSWKPVLKVSLPKPDTNGEFAPLKVSIKERQGDKAHVQKQIEQMEKEALGGGIRRESTMGGFGRSRSAKDQKPLEGVTTKFYISTEDGEVAYADMKIEKDQDSGKLTNPKPSWYSALHGGPVHTLQRSFFFKNIILCVGGWTFSILKEENQLGPLLSSCCSQKKYTAAHWSPTRPGVFFIATEEGNVEVWDLLDKTHEPTLTQNITACSITRIFPWQISSKQQLLAVSDDMGTLHILEVPWNLRHPSSNEATSIQNYFEREEKRLEYYVDRLVFREKEKRDIDAEEQRIKNAPPPAEENEDQIQEKMRREYEAYLQLENELLISLGVKQEEDEPLPEK
ncbi:dynein axonemal intermediate chain 3-like [Branchiostoma lanceolatum]|uniref:dynein axonemal intermediate chain 3-like n=1 Tax=Branchiostoma lanceolatum TaxID=7740 RepID=UPI003456A11F